MESSHGRALQRSVRAAQEQVTLAKGRKENLRMFNRRLQQAEEKLEKYLADTEGQQRSGKSLSFNPADDQRRSLKRSQFDHAEPEVNRWSCSDRRSRTPTNRYTESRRSRSPPVHRKSSFGPLEERQRYRFDQAEPEAKHWSRIDRRSRTPINRHTESRQSRSPAAHRKSSFGPLEERQRYRFDQAEPEVKHWSRIDRRSRTPTKRRTESRRSRSPVAHRKSSFGPLEKRQRYRFDQAEPEVKHWSRIDRRSRTPTNRHTESRRSRSPVGGKSSFSAPEERELSPDARAVAAAARKTSSRQAKEGIQHVNVPSIRATASPLRMVSSSGVSRSRTSIINRHMYMENGDFIKDIEVNDLRDRYTLTKGETQKMIKEDTGADVTTRGSYYPDKSMATVANPPLYQTYLHITSTSKNGLEEAVKRVEELMKQELPNLVDERRFRQKEPKQVERDEFSPPPSRRRAPR